MSPLFTVDLEGALKPGTFTLPVTDVKLPGAGPNLPITVSRTYSTLRAGESLDFGYGWSLDLGRPATTWGGYSE